MKAFATLTTKAHLANVPLLATARCRWPCGV